MNSWETAVRLCDSGVDQQDVTLLCSNDNRPLLFLSNLFRIPNKYNSITHGEEGLCAVPLREAALPMPVVWLYPQDMYIRKAMQKFMELI